MSEFVNCIGCGASIHHTAATCPKCGAPQSGAATPPPIPPSASSSASGAVPPLPNVGLATLYTEYQQVPWYRRRWFIILMICTLTPIATILALTGELFYSSAGAVKRFAQRERQMVMGASFFWVVYVLRHGVMAIVASLLLFAVSAYLATRK